jgi:uncharacterized alpha-E superfamily protein
MSIFSAQEDHLDELKAIRARFESEMYPRINDLIRNHRKHADLLAATDDLHNMVDDAVNNMAAIIQDMRNGE